jgi:lipopolysaccharide export LptBFGC system permease protein LptF
MRLLDRYLLRELLTPLGFCLGGFLVFWVAFDLLGTLDDLHQLGATLPGLVQLYWIRLPELLLTVIPFALLLALLYVLTAHSKHHELTAMRAAGVSLWRICLPYFGVGLLASVGLYALNEFWLPDAKEQEDQLKASWGSQANAAQRGWRRLDFKNQADDRAWSIGAFNLTNGEVRQLRIALFLAPDGYREITADGVRWTNGYWRLTNGTERIFRWADDPLPAAKSKSLFTAAEMGGPPDVVAGWSGQSLTLTNEVYTNGFLLRTNLVREGVESGQRWSLESLRPASGEGGRLQFRAPLGQGARRLIAAESGRWSDGAWTFYGVRDFLFRSGTDDNYLDQPYAELTLAGFTETPEIMRSELRVGAQLNRTKTMRRPQLGAREILNYQRLHPQIPARDQALLDTQLQARFAAPWTCLVVVLIAIPFGSPSGRRNVFYGVAGSLAVGFTYFVLQRLGFALGQGGQVAPWLAAWLPNLCFALTGVGLINRVR